MDSYPAFERKPWCPAYGPRAFVNGEVPTSGGVVSDSEGQVVTCGPHTFRIVNGRRIWLSTPPAEHLSELLEMSKWASS